ncbi:MAG: hypothetical protein KJ025_20910 [Burkholderiales bacterium]|nr:hypothetical protein [Burkholderiales bacterium]
MRHAGRSAKWWYWLAASLALAAALAGWPPGLPLAFAAVGAQSLHFLAREGRPGAFAVQVPVAYLALLAVGAWPPLAVLHPLMLAGTLVTLAFDYCPLARIMSLMPWNRRVPLSWALVRRTFLMPPTAGSVLQARA